MTSPAHRSSSEDHGCSSEEHGRATERPCMLLRGSTFRPGGPALLHPWWNRAPPRSTAAPPRTTHAPPRINVPPRRTNSDPPLVESCSSEEHGCATEDHACSSEDQRSSSDEHRCSWVAPRCSSEEEPTFSKAQYVGTRTQAGTANGVNACSPDRPRGAATRERTAEMRRRISSMVGRGPPYGRIANARGSATIVA